MHQPNLLVVVLAALHACIGRTQTTQPGLTIVHTDDSQTYLPAKIDNNAHRLRKRNTPPAPPPSPASSPSSPRLHPDGSPLYADGEPGSSSYHREMLDLRGHVQQISRHMLTLKQRELQLQAPSPDEKREMSALNQRFRHYDASGIISMMPDLKEYWKPDYTTDSAEYYKHPSSSAWLLDARQHDDFESTERTRQALMTQVGKLQDHEMLEPGLAALKHPRRPLLRAHSESSLAPLRHVTSHAGVDREGRVALSIEQEHADRERVATAKEIIRNDPRIGPQNAEWDPAVELMDRRKRVALHGGHARTANFRDRARPTFPLEELDERLKGYSSIAQHSKEEEEPTTEPQQSLKSRKHAAKQQALQALHAFDSVHQSGHVFDSPRYEVSQQLTGDGAAWDLAHMRYFEFSRPIDQIAPIPMKGYRHQLWRSDNPQIREHPSSVPKSLYEGLRQRNPKAEAVAAEAQRRQQAYGPSSKELRRTSSSPVGPAPADTLSKEERRRRLLGKDDATDGRTHP